jgi:hypothetical protein
MTQQVSARLDAHVDDVRRGDLVISNVLEDRGQIGLVTRVATGAFGNFRIFWHTGHRGRFEWYTPSEIKKIL